MAIKDAFLPLVGEPDPAAIAAIDKCIAMAGNIGARVTAAAAEAVRSASNDALPMLQAAANVRIITATDKQTPAELESGSALVNHLAEHGIKATFETVKIDGSSVGKVFEAYVEANGIDLLVIGALSAFPAERSRLGWRDQNRHRTATVLGYDVALGGR